jgi:hypothetical protein
MKLRSELIVAYQEAQRQLYFNKTIVSCDISAPARCGLEVRKYAAKPRQALPSDYKPN